MLSDRDLQLLTACVDGELSPRQRRHVERLLRHSEKARETLRRLQADSKELIDLPRVAAPADLAGSVLAAADRVKRRPPTARPHPAAAQTFPAWTGWAAAALVVVAVGLGSFLEYDPGPAEGQEVAAKKDREDGEKPAPHDGVLVRNAPAPNQPAVLKLHELGKADEAKKLRQELDGRSAVRVELAAKNATHAFARVKSALDARKIAVVIDPIAKKSLETPQSSHDYALFLENVTAADLAELIAAVAALDRAAGEKKAGEQRFDGSLVVKAVSSHDQDELKMLLGVDPTRVRPAPPKPVHFDLSSEQPPKQAVGKQAPRPATSQPGMTVLVVPLGGRSGSVEVKNFLTARKPPREGTLQVFIVLRQVST